MRVRNLLVKGAQRDQDAQNIHHLRKDVLKDPRENWVGDPTHEIRSVLAAKMPKHDSSNCIKAALIEVESRLDVEDDGIVHIQGHPRVVAAPSQKLERTSNEMSSRSTRGLADSQRLVPCSRRLVPENRPRPQAPLAPQPERELLARMRRWPGTIVCSQPGGAALLNWHLSQEYMTLEVTQKRRPRSARKSLVGSKNRPHVLRHSTGAWGRLKPWPSDYEPSVQEEQQEDEDSKAIRPDEDKDKALKPLFDFKKVYKRLQTDLLHRDPHAAKRLLLGLHERFYRCPISDFKNMLLRAGLSSDVLALAEEAVMSCSICRKYTSQPASDQDRCRCSRLQPTSSG